MAPGDSSEKLMVDQQSAVALNMWADECDPASIRVRVTFLG